MAILVHHELESHPDKLSPFVEHINAIVQSGEIRIACPYVSVRVLREILIHAERWRLLTDLEELLRSHAPSHRAELLRFITDHNELVRHWPGLHAKVVAGPASALVGSANLTEMGLAKRQEVAVVLNDPQIIAQLQSWFDDLWIRCRAVLPAELSAFVNALPRGLPEARSVRLPSPASVVSATVFPAEKPPLQSSSADRLLSRLAHAASRDWADAYLDLCADLLSTLDIREEDERLSMSVPKNLVLPVTLSQRYVICAFHRGLKVVGMMLPRDVQIPDTLLPSMAMVRETLGTFEKWRDEQSDQVPKFAYFDVDDPHALLVLRDDWMAAVLRETERPWRRSSFRRHHVPAFYRAVMDVNYRRGLLEEAFPTS